MANSAFTHNPSITVPGSSTNTALVRWSSTGADTFLDSTIIVGATTMGLAADTDLLTFGNGTLAITGAITGVTTITATTFAGTLSGNATGSAATLTNARTIGGVSFNGSVNINLPGVNAVGDQNTSGTAAGLSTALVVASGGTGLTSYTAGDMFYYASGTTLTKLAKGSANEVLTMNDGATAPEWEEAAGGGPDQAVRSELEAAETNDVDKYSPPDLIHFVPSAVKAWISWTSVSTTAIKDDYNFSGVTDNGTGDTILTFDNDMVDTDYAWAGATGTGERIWMNTSNVLSTSIEVISETDAGTNTDQAENGLMVAGVLAA